MSAPKNSTTQTGTNAPPRLLLTEARYLWEPTAFREFLDEQQKVRFDAILRDHKWVGVTRMDEPLAVALTEYNASPKNDWSLSGVLGSGVLPARFRATEYMRPWHDRALHPRAPLRDSPYELHLFDVQTILASLWSIGGIRLDHYKSIATHSNFVITLCDKFDPTHDRIELLNMLTTLPPRMRWSLERSLVAAVVTNCPFGRIVHFLTLRTTEGRAYFQIFGCNVCLFYGPGMFIDDMAFNGCIDEHFKDDLHELYDKTKSDGMIFNAIARKAMRSADWATINENAEVRLRHNPRVGKAIAGGLTESDVVSEIARPALCTYHSRRLHFLLLALSAAAAVPPDGVRGYSQTLPLRRLIEPQNWDLDWLSMDLTPEVLRPQWRQIVNGLINTYSTTACGFGILTEPEIESLKHFGQSAEVWFDERESSGRHFASLDTVKALLDRASGEEDEQTD